MTEVKLGYQLLIGRTTAQGTIGLTIATETLTLHPSEAHAIGTGLSREYNRTPCYESNHYVETETDPTGYVRIRIIIDATTITDMENRQGPKYVTLIELWLAKDAATKLSEDLCDYAIQATDPR